MAQAARRKKAEIGKMDSGDQALPPGVEKLSVEADASEWTFKVAGPAPYYEGGFFKLVVKIPENYPFKAPDFSFHPQSCPYHPSVTWSGDERGALCPAALGIQDWKPPTMIADVIRQVIEMLKSPKDHKDHALVPEIAAELSEREDEFKKKAKQSCADARC